MVARSDCCWRQWEEGRHPKWRQSLTRAQHKMVMVMICPAPYGTEAVCLWWHILTQKWCYQTQVSHTWLKINSYIFSLCLQVFDFWSSNHKIWPRYNLSPWEIETFFSLMKLKVWTYFPRISRTWGFQENTGNHETRERVVNTTTIITVSQLSLSSQLNSIHMPSWTTALHLSALDICRRIKKKANSPYTKLFCYLLFFVFKTAFVYMCLY